MNKFVYDKQGFRYTGTSHACDIKRTGYHFDIVIRGIIFDKGKIIYLRINDLSIYQGLEYKRATYNFDNNLRACGLYLKNNFKGFRVFDSYTISKLPYNIQRDILNS